MKLPDADQAIIAEEKLVRYLLNANHRKGASKARLLLAMGYLPDLWQRLEADIRRQHLEADVSAVEETDYGLCYAIVAPLTGPSGQTVIFRSIWQIDIGTDIPRLITMYPE